MKNTKAAARYAKALFDLAKERAEIDRVFDDMNLTRQQIADNSGLGQLLRSPVIKADTKMAVLNKTLGGQIGQTALAFIKIIADKGRETLIPEIAEEFVRQVKKHKNILTVQVSSATAIDAETRARIISMVKVSHHGEIELIEKVTPAILGGFILTVGDRQVDASVSGQLRRMRKEFKENPYETKF